MSGNASFESRLEAELKEADERVKDFQSRAGDETRSLLERYDRFSELRQQLRARVFEPRLQSLMEKLPVARTEPRSSRDGGEMKIVFDRTEDHPALVIIDFQLSHDGRVRQMILDYRLSIVPCFLKYNPHNRLELDLDDVTDEKVAEWLDDCLIEFTRSFLEIGFIDEYQKAHIVTDPVSNIRLTKSHAFGTIEEKGHTYYFASEESLQAFKESPERYAII